MSSRTRAVWMLGALALAALGLGTRQPDAAWVACAILAPAAWPGLRERLSLRPSLAGLSLVAAAMAAADRQPAIAAAALAMGGCASGRGPRSLAAIAVGLTVATWVLRGQAAGVAVVATACGAATLLQLSEIAADGALTRVARRGIVISGRDALRVAGGIDGIVLALPRGLGDPSSRAVSPAVRRLLAPAGRSPAEHRDGRQEVDPPGAAAGGEIQSPSRRGPPVEQGPGCPAPRAAPDHRGAPHASSTLTPDADAPPTLVLPTAARGVGWGAPGAALLRPPDDRGRQGAGGAGSRPRPAARGQCAPLPPATAGLRALGCEVWQRGRVVPLRTRTDDHAFAVADMLARGRRVAVVAPPGGPAPAGDLLVETGGRLSGRVAPAVALPAGDLGALVDFLRLARRLRRACAGLGLAAVLVGGPGVACAALGRVPVGGAAWLAVGAAALLAAGMPGAATIFTSSQRRYG